MHSGLPHRAVTEFATKEKCTPWIPKSILGSQIIYGVRQLILARSNGKKKTDKKRGCAFFWNCLRKGWVGRCPQAAGGLGDAPQFAGKPGGH